MANWQEEIEKAREEAKRARDEADRLRREARDLARKIRDEARREAHRLRDEGREEFRRNRHVAGSWAGRAGESGRVGDGELTAEATFSLEGVQTVTVDQGSGKLTIRVCAEGETPGVVATSRIQPRIDVQREGDQLRIAVPQSKGWLLRRRSGPNTTVRLASGPTELRANLGYGDLVVRDLTVNLARLDIGAGTLVTFAVSAKIHANVGAGKLSITAHRGLVSASTGTGDVQLDIAQVEEGEYKVDVGMGRLEVRLPKDANVRIETSSGIGKVSASYPNGGPGAPSVLKASTGIGEVSVKERSPESATGPQGTPKPQRPGAPTANRHEAEELRILQMLEQGKISSQDAAELIAALRGAGRVSGRDEESG